MHARAPGSHAPNAATTAIERLLWIPPVLFAAWRYHPITANYFFGDDLYNLYEIVNRGVVEYLVKPYGLHLLAARNLAFYLCFHFFGTNAAPYFWLVLLTHLVNVFLLFQIVRLFTGPRLACFGATLWGLSPVDEGALGWFSVYGQVLATALMLWVLYRLAQLAAGAVPSRTAPLRWAALVLVASVSFGTGIGAAMVFPVVALLLLPPAPTRRRTLAVFAVVAVALPFLFLLWHRAAALQYDAPDTSHVDDALAGLQIWPQILQIAAQLTAFGTSTLVLAPLRYPISYPSTVSDVVAWTAVAAVATALVLGTARRRRQLLAMLVLAAGCYGIIAAGRVEVIVDTQLVAATRYHYQAVAPLCIAAMVLVAMLGEWRPLPAAWHTPALIASLAILVGLQAVGASPIDHHARERAAAMRAVADIRGRVDAAPAGSDVYITNTRFAGVGPFMFKRTDLYPGLLAVFAVYFPNHVIDGRRVFFVVDDPDVLETARRGRKTGAFVIGPGEQQRPTDSATSSARRARRPTRA